MADFDALALLMENTGKGFLSVIEYDKGDPSPRPKRLVEPKKLIEGVDSTLVRSLQHEPEQGHRNFIIEKIVVVECTSRPLSEAHNSFCDADVVPREIAFKRSHRYKTPGGGEMNFMMTGHSTRRGQSFDWFVDYARQVRVATTDLAVTDAEAKACEQVRRRFNMSEQQMRAVHAYIFAETLVGLAFDGAVTKPDEDQIHLMLTALGDLGWRPC